MTYEFKFKDGDVVKHIHGDARATIQYAAFTAKDNIPMYIVATDDGWDYYAADTMDVWWNAVPLK